MPTTINGIGTTYYGKSNVHVRPGVCPHCQKMSQLESYETRHWFVFVFIPIIPLGKKQILDYCPLCTMHGATSVGQWQQASEEAIRDAMEQAEAQPDDPTTALRLIGTLSSYQQHEEANRYSKIVEEKYSDNAEVQWELGAWHDSEGRSTKADACFRRVLEIEPENESAKRALAIGLIGQGEMEPARELLSYLDQPGAQPDPQVQSLLAETYHARGEHEPALEHYARLIKEAPQIARDRKFRKRVRQSEKAVGREVTILPRSRRPGPMLWWTAVLVVLALAGFLYNHYWKTHQTLHVINGFQTPIEVTIDDDKTLTVPPLQRQTVPIAEGKHLAIAQYEGAEIDRIDFDITNTLTQRLFGNATFVVNPSGAGTLIRETAIYSEHPNNQKSNPFQLHFGKSWIVYRDLDYPFEEPPIILNIGSSQGSVSKKCLSLCKAQPSLILAYHLHSVSTSQQIEFAEHHLLLDPDNTHLTLGYANIALENRTELKRAREFFKQGLDRRPVSVDWHRSYQWITGLSGDVDSLVPLYDRMLGEDPKNSNLLYLRGRLERRTTGAIAYCDRALDADPQNAHAWSNKAYHLQSRGEFEEAKKMALEAYRLDPDLNHRTLFWIRFALQEYDALEPELRDLLLLAPLSLSDQNHLLAVLMANGDAIEAEQIQRTFSLKVHSNLPDDSFHFEAQSKMALAYLKGDMATYLEQSQKIDATKMDGEMFAAQIELGDFESAESHCSENFGLFNQLGLGSKALLLSLGWSEKGNREKADQWYQTAIDSFSEGKHPSEKQIAVLLQADDDSLALEDVDDSSAEIDVKAIVLIALARKNARHREALLRRAKKLILPGFFPNRFLQRMLDATSE